MIEEALKDGRALTKKERKKLAKMKAERMKELEESFKIPNEAQQKQDECVNPWSCLYNVFHPPVHTFWCFSGHFEQN